MESLDCRINILKIVNPAKDLFQTILSIYFKNSIDTSIKICSLFFLGSKDDGQTSLHTKRINLPLESYGQFNTNELSFGLIWGEGGVKFPALILEWTNAIRLELYYWFKKNKRFRIHFLCRLLSSKSIYSVNILLVSRLLINIYLQ